MCKCIAPTGRVWTHLPDAGSDQGSRLVGGHDARVSGQVRKSGPIRGPQCPLHPPQRADVIRAYDNLRWYCKKFAEGALGLLMVVGPPGVGKSEVMKRSVGEKLFWIEGRTTPFEVYRTLYRQRDRAFLHVVLNDAQSFWDRKGDQGGSGISLLKQLCETRREKTLSWQSIAAERAV